MANNKHFRDMNYNEKTEAVKTMPTELLFEELEDTIRVPFDIFKKCRMDYNEKVRSLDTYYIITDELKRRLGVPEEE